MNDKTDNDNKSISRNIMINGKLDRLIEESRIINKGSSTEIKVSRSDKVNEFLALGAPMYKLKQELGEEEIKKIIQLLQKLNLREVNLEKIL